MLIEAVEKSITYRWPGGEVCLEPGKPVELPDDRACRLLAKCPGKVWVVQSGDVLIEPAAPPARPVYWQSMDGQVHGPCAVSFMARTGPPGHSEFWLCVEDQRRIVWIREDRLVSHREKKER